MTDIIVDEPTIQKLHGLVEPVQICGPGGQVLGFFSPALSKDLYEGVDSPASKEELDRRSKETGGRSLAEILKDLEKRT